MSDLRTRIAAVVGSHRPQRREWITCICDGYFSHFTEQTWEWHVADAVIRELGLKRVIDVNRSVPQARYVTDWKADDE